MGSKVDHCLERGGTLDRHRRCCIHDSIRDVVRRPVGSSHWRRGRSDQWLCLLRLRIARRASRPRGMGARSAPPGAPLTGEASQHPLVADAADRCPRTPGKFATQGDTTKSYRATGPAARSGSTSSPGLFPEPLGFAGTAGSVAGAVGMSARPGQSPFVDDQILLANGTAVKPAFQDLTHASSVASLR